VLRCSSNRGGINCGDFIKANASFADEMNWSGVIKALKSSGRFSLAVSEMTRTVALGIFLSRQIPRIVSDSISTASAPVLRRSSPFSAAVIATRFAQ